MSYFGYYILMVKITILAAEGKKWSTTMLSRMVTSRSTGRTMSRLGSTSLPGKPGEELVSYQSCSITFCAMLYFTWTFVCFMLYSARQKKAVKIFPRPTAGPLRPVVHGQTLKYNMKVRTGKGFTLEELKVFLSIFFLCFHFFVRYLFVIFTCLCL